MNRYSDEIIQSLLSLRDDLLGPNYRTALSHPLGITMMRLGFAILHSNDRECHHTITFKGLWILFVMETEGLTKELVDCNEG